MKPVQVSFSTSTAPTGRTLYILGRSRTTGLVIFRTWPAARGLHELADQATRSVVHRHQPQSQDRERVIDSGPRGRRRRRADRRRTVTPGDVLPRPRGATRGVGSWRSCWRDGRYCGRARRGSRRRSSRPREERGCREGRERPPRQNAVARRRSRGPIRRKRARRSRPPSVRPASRPGVAFARVSFPFSARNLTAPSELSLTRALFPRRKECTYHVGRKLRVFTLPCIACGSSRDGRQMIRIHPESDGVTYEVIRIVAGRAQRRAKSVPHQERLEPH